MNKKILYAVIAAAMFLSMTALSGCDSDSAGTSSVNLSDSDTESVVYQIDSESDSDIIDSSSDEETAASEKGADSNSDKNDTKSEKAASSKTASSKTVSSKADSSKAVSSKSTSSSKTVSSKADSSKAMSSESTSSKSESSKTSSEELTDDEALEIVLNNTHFTKDELDSIEVSEENGERFHNVYFCENGNYENGTYVFYVRDSDKKFFTSEEFNVEYHADTSLGIDEKRALAIVLQNTDFTEDELQSSTVINIAITEGGESFYSLSFFRNGTYVFYVRDRDGKFFTSEEFNNTYYSSDEPVTDEEEKALRIVLENTDYTEDELLGIYENEADGDKFYNVGFFRNGTYVFYVRQKDYRFYTYDDFNKAYNEYYDGYTGHD